MSAEARRTIEVVDPDPAWAAWFAELRDAIAPAVGDLAVAIEHIGSTSVPGLAAKPIVDMNVVIAHRDDLPATVAALATLGYIHQGDRGVPGREAFRGAEAPVVEGISRRRPHHLYVCAADSEEHLRQVLFRDYLRAHPEAAAAYGALKKELAAQHPHDIDAYIAGKAFFVQGCVRAAQEAAGAVPDAPPGDVGREIRAYYDRREAGHVREAARLAEGSGRLEAVRTRELLRRHLPPPPAVILDVGGGPATHAGWLARDGYEVHLLDPMASLLEAARQVSAQQPQHPIASIAAGEARRLQGWADGSVDAVLLLGPLYHLTEREQRLAALGEALRVVRPGGPVVAAGISRFASALDGLLRHFVHDPAFRRILRRDLADGQHRSAPERGRYFTTAYFHHPRELTGELEAAGLEGVVTYGVEGPAWLLHDLEARWADPEKRRDILETVRALETEPSVLGASGHLLAVGHRPDGGS